MQCLEKEKQGSSIHMISYYTHSPELMIVVAVAGHEAARAKPGRVVQRS